MDPAVINEGLSIIMLKIITYSLVELKYTLIVQLANCFFIVHQSNYIGSWNNR